MKRYIRKLKIRKVKRIASLSGVSLVFVLLAILLEPVYTFAFRTFYACTITVFLMRLWIIGLRDMDDLVLA